MEELEGPATIIYNYELGNFGEKENKKEEDWQQMLAQGQSLKKNSGVTLSSDIIQNQQEEQEASAVNLVRICSPKQ